MPEALKCPECGGNCSPECGLHPLGCQYGGSGEGFWLVADGCTLDHPTQFDRDMQSEIDALNPEIWDDGTIDSTGPNFFAYNGGFESICLDGSFTPNQLLALAWWVRKHQTPCPPATN